MSISIKRNLQQMGKWELEDYRDFQKYIPDGNS